MPRQDLNKVLCERERHAGHGANKGRKAKGDQAWPFTGESTSPYPFKEGIKAPHRGREKTLSEHLNPLYGFLRKSVGKKWDKVYSELKSVFDTRRVINQHILLHLFDAVETHTFMHKGVVSYTDTRGWKREGGGIKPITESNSEFYVSSPAGILLKNKGHEERKKREALALAARIRDRNDHLQLLAKFKNQSTSGARYAVKIKDIWYEVSVVERPKAERRKKVLTTGEVVSYYHHPEVISYSIHGAKYMPPELNNEKFYVNRKEQLSSERLRKIGLK